MYEKLKRDFAQYDAQLGLLGAPFLYNFILGTTCLR